MVWVQNTHFLMKLIEIIYGNQSFSELFDSIKLACKIWKWMKNENIVSQLVKICSFQTGVFPRIQDLKLLFARHFWIIIKNHKFFLILCCYTALSIIWDLVDQNLYRTWWENGISLIVSKKAEKNKVGDYLGVPSVAPKT